MDVRGWRGSTLTAGDGVHPRRRPGLQGLSRARAESCNGLMSTTAREQGETRGAMGPLGGLCSRGVILSRLDLHCRWILYQLSYQGSPRELKGLF